MKSPKVYVRDSGLLHQLLGIGSAKALSAHPKVGASWEGFAIEQVLDAEPHDEAFFSTRSALRVTGRAGSTSSSRAYRRQLRAR